MDMDLRQSAEVTVDQATCTACGACVAVCAAQNLALVGGRIEVARRSFLGCIGCGQCAMTCPTGSIRVTGRRLTADTLVKLPPASDRASSDQLDALLLGRRSIRRFADREVDRAVIERILAMTATAPVDIPPSDVKILVFHGRERVRQLAADAVACFRRLQWMLRPWTLALMRPLMGKANHEAMRDFIAPLLEAIIASHQQGQDVFSYDAPAALVFYCEQSELTNCVIAATYATIAAESFGLGSCMIGSASALAHDKAFKTKYGIAAKAKVSMALILGYPVAKFRRGVRRQFSSVQWVGDEDD